MTIVSVRLETDSLLAVPAELVATNGKTSAVKFAAGNVRIVSVSQVSSASFSEIKEYHAMVR